MKTFLPVSKRFVALVCLAFLSASTLSLSAAEVEVPNFNLANQLREVLGLSSSEPITEEALETLIEFEAYNVSDFTGMEAAVNLESLKATSFGGSTVAPLADLQKLTTLTLYGALPWDPFADPVELDIDALADHPSLERVTIARCNVTDISALGSIAGLEYLNLTGNYGSTADFSILESATNLRELVLEGAVRVTSVISPIGNLEPLSGLTQLERLDLSDASVNSLAPLENLTQLKSLDISRTRVSDLSPLVAFSDLESFEYSRLAVSDSPLAQNSPTKINSIEIAANWPQLKVLDISGHPISDLSPLASLQNLEELLLKETDVSDISPISVLTQLRLLALEAISLSDLDDLDTLDALTVLNFSRTDVVNLAPLLEMDALQEVDASQCLLELYAGTAQAQIVAQLEAEGVTINVSEQRGIYMPDTALRGVVKTAIGLEAEESLTADALLALEQLDASGLGISDLTGLEYATEVVEADLSDNLLESIDGGFNYYQGSLEIIDLSGNRLETIPSVSNALRVLRVDRNRITSFFEENYIGTYNTLDELSVKENLLDLRDRSYDRKILKMLRDAGVQVYVEPQSDMDRDGLHDALEQQMIDADPNDDLNTLDDVDPRDDFDGDTVSNAAEIAQGTDPLDNTSYNIGLAWIPDPNLKGSIRSALNLDYGAEVTRAALAELKTLMVSGDVYDLTGLEYARNLETISVFHYKGYNLDALAGLDQLQEVSIHAGVVDITGLKDLPLLWELHLGDNYITEISVLETLPALDYVNLGDNLLDLTTGSAASQTIATLQASGVSTIVGTQKDPENLDRDEDYLNDAWEQILVDADPDDAIDSIEDVDAADDFDDDGFYNSLESQQDSDPTDPDSHPEVVIIEDPVLASAVDHTLFDYGDGMFLKSEIPDVHTIDLRGKGIEVIPDMSQLTGLERVRLPDNQITDLSPLSNLTQIEELILDENQITDLSPLSGLTNLRQLDISNNNVTDLSPLQNLNNLEDLQLYNNEVTELSPLANLQKLDRLSVFGNQLKNLHGLEDLPNLRLVYAQDNQITDLSAVTGLPKLQHLHVGNNLITTLAQLVEEPTPELNSVYTEGNKIDAQRDAVAIAELTSRLSSFYLGEQDPEPYSFEMAPMSKQVSAAPISYEIEVTSDIDWDVTSLSTWVSASPTSGSGNGTVTISVGANTILERSATIMIAGREHIVTQDAPEDAEIDPELKTVGSEGETYQIKVTSADPWMAITGPNARLWLSVSPESGQGGETISVTVYENKGSARSGSIIISGTTHSVYQDAKPEVSLGLVQKKVSAAAQSYELLITATGSWEVTNIPPWASLSQTAGETTARILVSVEANRTSAERSGTLGINDLVHQIVQEGTETVAIPDRELLRALREVTDRSSGAITAMDLASLTELDLSGLGITDISGLEKAVNLEILNLSNNRIETIQPLSSLAYLQELDVSQNGLDITEGSSVLEIISSLIRSGVEVTFEPQTRADLWWDEITPASNGYSDTSSQGEPGIGWVNAAAFPWIHTYGLGNGAGEWAYVLSSESSRSSFFAYCVGGNYWFWASSEWGWYYRMGDNPGWHSFNR